MEYDKIVYFEFDKNEKEKLINRVKNLLMKEKRIKVAYLFGSFTRRNKVRDIDIAIYAVPKLSLSEQLRLGGMIESELKVAVDLVQFQDLQPSFNLKILQKGIPIIKSKYKNYLLASAFSELMDLKLAKSYLNIDSCS